jgi:homogentisate 1,2-dioxygenase
MYQKGNVPRRGEQSELYNHMYTRKGFFGPYATLYKTRNPGEPIRRDKGLGPCAIDLDQTRPSDLERPDGLPMALFSNGDVTVSVSRRREAMPFCWRNVDGDELFFLHRGAARFETELGALNAETGDFVYLPRNIVYRVIPQSDDAVHIVVETQSWLEPADRYHREHGETSSGLDMSQIVVPEPGDNVGPPRSEYEVRVKIEGEVYSAFFDYDPVGVTAGWSGDPIVFKLSAWDCPCAYIPSTPPTGSVFISDGMGCIVGVRGSIHSARGDGGPPPHTNDYDELWFLHSTESPERARQLGHLRWEPQGDTQPGARRSSGNGPRPGPDGKSLNLNIDVRNRLRLTREAQAYVADLRPAVAATA